MLHRLLKINSLLLILWVISSIAKGDNIGIHQYQYQLLVPVNNDQSVQYFQIPKIIHEKLKGPLTFDLSVFDQQNRAVPYILADQLTQRKVFERTLSIFALTDQEIANEAAVRVRIEQKNQAIDVENLYIDSTVKKTHHYIIDLSDIYHPKAKSNVAALTRLYFEFVQGAQFLSEVSISHSTDLRKWQLIKNQTLATLTIEKNQLVKNSIDLPSAKFPYLKLSWNNDTSAPLIKSVRGTFLSRQPIKPISQSTSILNMEQINDNTIDVQLPGVYPDGFLDFSNIRSSGLYRGQIMDILEDELLDYLTPFTQYRLKLASTTLYSEPVKISRSNNRGSRAFRLIFNEPVVVTSDDLVGLRYQYDQQAIVFVSKKPGTYSLAFARRNTNQVPLLPSSVGLRQLMSQVQANGKNLSDVMAKIDISNLQLNTIDVLDDHSVFVSTDTLILLVLMLATVVVVAMAYRLYRQTR